MTSDTSEGNTDVTRERLERLLEELKSQGITQSEVSRRSHVPSQYLSDIKSKNRNMTELIARRLADAFQFDYRWLLGQVGGKELPRLGPDIAQEGGGGILLPVFPHPVEGPPREFRRWDGSSVEICGAAVERARSAVNPYVLRFERDDCQGRLRKYDLLLVSQGTDPSAEFQLVKHGRSIFIARKQKDGSFLRAADGEPFPAESQVVGHVVGIVWAVL